MMNYRHILAGLCIAFFFVVFIAVASATIYVHDNYTKIQWAVDNASADDTIFDNGIWWIKKDSSEPYFGWMKIYLDGEYKGECSRLDFGHKVEGADSWPQVAVIYASGYIRLKECREPDINFGTSFVLGPGCWEGSNYYHNVSIKEIRINSSKPFEIQIKATLPHFNVTYDIEMLEPSNETMKIHIDQIYECTNRFTLNESRLSKHEGFKIAQLSSMYINGTHHDSDGVKYIDEEGKLVIKKFEDLKTSQFILDNPKKFGENLFECTHSDDYGWQGNTPNCIISLDNLTLAKECTPQGWITITSNPNEDNIGLWIHNDKAQLDWNVGDKDSVSYWLIAQDNPINVCSPGWHGTVIIACEDLKNWSVESDTDSNGTLELVPGFIGKAVKLNWDLGSGNWTQGKYTFPEPINLSNYDIFGVSFHGSNSTPNRVSLIFADTHDVFYGCDFDGINSIDRWMKNIAVPRKLFYKFWDWNTTDEWGEIDWSNINRFFFVVKRPSPMKGGGSGQLTIDYLQADRAQQWSRQDKFHTSAGDSEAARKAVGYILSQQKATGLFLSWKEESPPKAWLYDQALVLRVLTREGTWLNGNPTNNEALRADKLVNFIANQQMEDGHWPRCWNPETGKILSWNDWVGDQAWMTFALQIYRLKSGNDSVEPTINNATEWLKKRINMSTGKVVNSTEGNVDVWWAMIATGNIQEAERIEEYLLSIWDNDSKYWPRGFNDSFVAIDCQTWLSHFARSPWVNEEEKGMEALSFARRALVTTDEKDTICGFDGMGPVSVWCEGTAQYIAAGGEDSQFFMDNFMSIQNPDGSLPGCPDEKTWESCFGWLSPWSGLAPTAWFYFAITEDPFISIILHAKINKSVYEHNENVVISCVVQNEIGINIIANVSGCVKKPDGFLEELAFDKITTGNYNASYTNTTINGTYYVTIYANMTGYKNATTSLNFIVGSSPCFIATAAYGTPLHEDIDVLRDFRDEYLMTNPIGRTFVKIYYTTSPPIADVIRENEGLRRIVREGLVKPLVYISRWFVG